MSLISEISKWNKERQVALIQSYENEGLRASGKWASELGGYTKQDGPVIKTVIDGAKYTGALVGGRGTTKSKGSGVSLRSVIRKWIDDKGITPRDKISKDSLAFLIARKIHREGIRVPNEHNTGKLVSNAITQESLNELESIIKRGMAELAKTEVLTALKN